MSADLERLRSRLEGVDRLVTAFSGGADSALLAAVAHDVVGEGAIAVTAVSASLPAAELAAARAFATSIGLTHVEVRTDEFERQEYVRNDANRCFHCKTALFDAIEPIARSAGARIALGTNLDDLGDHRPGQAAARMRGAVFPLVEAGLDKAAVRAVSRELGLVTTDKPAAACLSSRIAYGDPVTPQLVARIEQVEFTLHNLGLATCRVRAHANGTIARVEVPVTDTADVLRHRCEIVEVARTAGFTFVALDLAGFRSGSMNALLQLGPSPADDAR